MKSVRILAAMLSLLLLTAWGSAPAAAQPCEPSACWGQNKVAHKAKAKKTAAVKQPKKQPQEIYMRAAP